MDSGQTFVTKDDHQLLVVQLAPNNSIHTVSIEGKWFEYDTGSRALHPSSTQTLLLPCNASSARILACESVVSAVTGEQTPYVVVAAKSGDVDDPDCSITLFILGANRKLYIAAQTFFLPSFCSINYGTDVLSILQSSLSILDGPTLLFLSENTGCFHIIHRICNVGSSQLISSELNHYTGKVNYNDLPPSRNDDIVDRSYDIHRLLSANVKFSHWHRTTLLTLHSIGISSCNDPEENRVPFSLVRSTIKITDGGQSIEHDTATSDLIPDIYASVCTSVLSIRNSRCHSFSHEGIQNDSEGTSTNWDAVICTKFGQMAQFCYNHLFSCQEIPAKDVKKMFMIDAFDNEYIAAVSPELGVITARLEDLKPCGQWSAAKHVVVGDFLRNGTEQLLLLPSGMWQETDTISRFCLTDFGFCSIDNLDDDQFTEPMEDTDSNNLGTIVEHLESRVQCGVSSLHEADYLCQQKMDVAQKTSNGLLGTAMGASNIPDCNHNINQSSMVDLFSNGGNHISTGASPIGAGDHQTLPFDVTETWQRIVGNKWVIGVDIVNRTQRDIAEISLSMIQDSAHVPKLKTHSKILKNIEVKKKKEAEPNMKRRKVLQTNGQSYGITGTDEEDVVSLTTVTDLPKFSFPKISCQLLLQWSFAGAPRDEMPVYGGGDACQPCAGSQCQWVCGQISLGAEDVVSEKYHVKMKMAHEEVDEAHRILKCLNAYQLETALQLQSSFLSQDDLVSALRKFGLTYHNMYHSYIDLELGMFYLLRVDLETKVPGQPHSITVHSNDENQLMMFIHMMYSDLPDDLNIIHGKRGNMATAMESALNHMVQEVNQSCTTVNKVLKSTEQTDEMDFGQDSAKQSIENIRKSFEQKKRKFMDDDLKASQPGFDFSRSQSLTDGAVSHMIRESESL